MISRFLLFQLMSLMGLTSSFQKSEKNSHVLRSPYKSPVPYAEEIKSPVPVSFETNVHGLGCILWRHGGVNTFVFLHLGWLLYSLLSSFCSNQMKTLLPSASPSASFMSHSFTWVSSTNWANCHGSIKHTLEMPRATKAVLLGLRVLEERRGRGSRNNEKRANVFAQKR